MSGQRRMKSCKIEYAGKDNGNIYINDRTPTITADSIGNCLHYGVYLTGTEQTDSTALESNNTVYNCANGHISE